MIWIELQISDDINARNYDLLKANGIKQILIVGPTNELKWHKSKEFKYMRIKIYDFPNSNIHNYFDSAITFINNAPTLVHCLYGISRSASIVIAYIMKIYKISFINAIKYVKTKRSIIHPNYGFVNKLIEYETKI